jgi:hypothetical protein
MAELLELQRRRRALRFRHARDAADRSEMTAGQQHETFRQDASVYRRTHPIGVTNGCSNGELLRIATWTSRIRSIVKELIEAAPVVVGRFREPEYGS